MFCVATAPTPARAQRPQRLATQIDDDVTATPKRPLSWQRAMIENVMAGCARSARGSRTSQLDVLAGYAIRALQRAISLVGVEQRRAFARLQTDHGADEHGVRGHDKLLRELAVHHQQPVGKNGRTRRV